MNTDMDDLQDAVDKSADTDFDPNNQINYLAGKSITGSVVVGLIANPNLATRRSGSKVKGFYRPGERPICLLDDDDHPYPIENEPLPKYFRMYCTPSDDDKRVRYPLQNEYLQGRLGKDKVENAMLWDTARWIDRLGQQASTPALALPTMPIVMTGDDFDASDIEGLVVEGVTATVFAVLASKEKIEHQEKADKIDANKLMRKADPIVERVDLAGSEERADADKILWMLMARMRTSWGPVKLAIFDHKEMSHLGSTQGVGKDVAAAVGRQRVIEGLRLAASIRKDILRERIAALQLSREANENRRLHNRAARLPEIVALSKAANAEARYPAPPGKILADNDNHFADEDIGIAA